MLVSAMMLHTIDEPLLVVIITIVPTGAFKGSAFGSVEGEVSDVSWEAAWMMG